MKILVYPATMEIGGSTLNALELAARVQARGHEVIVYGNDDALAEVASSLDLEVLSACDRAGWPSLADVARLRSVVKRRRIQIVHGYEGGPALDLAYLSSITSRLVPMTTIMSMVVPFELPRHSDMFVGTPQMQAEAASTRARVHLMEPPIDTDLNRAKDRTGARRRMGIVDGMTCLSIVCRLSEDLGKLPGVLEAVQVTDSLAWDHPLQLLVAGGGAGLSDLHAAANEVNTRHGRPLVLVAGPMIDPRDAYDAADIALGMGSSALKAMSFSKPLVVQGDHGFWRPFNHVTASDFAHTGMFGDGGDGAADLRPILEALLAAPSSWEELGRLGRATVETRYSLDAATDVLIAAYEQALLRPHERRVVWREMAHTSKELAKYRVAKWDERRCGGRIRSTVHGLRRSST